MDDALRWKCDIPSSIVPPIGTGAVSAIAGPDNYLDVDRHSCYDAIRNCDMPSPRYPHGAGCAGQRPSPEELARRFGVSRIPIRDALNLLAAEKLVRVRPNRGAQVICFSRKELAEVYSLRVILETDCLARAIPDVGYVDLERITQEARRCEIEAGNEGFPDVTGLSQFLNHRHLGICESLLLALINRKLITEKEASLSRAGSGMMVFLSTANMPRSISQRTDPHW